MKYQTRLLIFAIGIAVCAAILLVVVLLPDGRRFKAAFDAEFITRPDGYRGLCEHYDFELPGEPMQMDPGLMYKSLADGAVDLIDAFATDGRIPAYDLKIIQDNKDYFPPYYAVPIVRAETLASYPQLSSVFETLSGTLSNATMQRLNFAVDEKGESAAGVAERYLLEQGLIEAEPAESGSPAGTVTIGSKHFTEQEILGEMLALLIERTTNLAVNRKLNLGGTMICFNALKAGDLDLYVEYTGTGLMNILKLPVETDPEKAYEIVREEFSKRYNIVWTEPLGFNNTYTLAMRHEQAEELGIETISDLGAYLHSLEATD